MGTDIHGTFQRKTEAGWEDIATTYTFDRHYYLFAVLGDVRNGFGFAGIPTHEPVEPIAARRGLPEDFEIVDGEDHPIPEELMTDFEKGPYGSKTRWMGDHSHNWLSGAEMLASPWGRNEAIRYFFDEVRRLTDLHGEIRFVFGFDS